jgi:glycosyltransferase involved in cell wall biosynthesis
MKLLIISDAWQPQVNGVVRTYEHISAEMTKRGHDVKVIGPNEFISTPMPGYSEIRLALFPYRKLKKMIENFKPDSIHIAVEGPLGLAARRYCKKHNIAFSTSYHTHFPDYVAERVGFLPAFLKNIVRNIAIAHVRNFHKLSAMIMVATQSLEDDLRAWGFTSPMKRLLRGAKTDVFYAGEKTLFKDKPQPIMLFVGRVAIEKNIEAFLALNIKGTKVVVGEGPLLEKLQHKYPDVVFAGKRTGQELAEYYRSSDVFVFPSKTDTFGMVLIEALACGTPVAAYPVTGPKDIITEPFLGALNDDLKTAIEQALSNGTAAERVAHTQAYYTWESVAETFESYISGIGY